MVRDGQQSSHERIRELEAEVERLRELVYRDPLTGALNRQGIDEFIKLFFDEACAALKYPERRRSLVIKSFSVLFVDLDNFKRINDEHGHEAGDKALAQVASIIDRNIRRSDFAGRWGGEEIIVGLLGANEDEAYDVAEKIRQDIEATPFAHNDTPISLTASIGVAEISAGIESFADLIARADKAMYIAKKDRGKNTTVRFSEVAKG